MAIPEKLYKYQSFTTQSLLNLKSQAIYFGSPNDFNDPYDCAYQVNIEFPSDEDVESIRQFYLNDKSFPEEHKPQFAEAAVDELRENFMQGGASAIQQATANFLKSNGVTCFSECNDNLLMWSHYGGKYKGFCLEFSTKIEPFEKVHKVKYTSDFPAIKLTSLLIDQNVDFVQTLFCMKSLDWKYEREWRAIYDEVGKHYYYPAAALTGIYFGPDIDQPSLEIVCLILAGQNETVKFWRGSRSPSGFKVEFEPFTYTSYLEAKQKGLR